MANSKETIDYFLAALVVLIAVDNLGCCQAFAEGSDKMKRPKLTVSVELEEEVYRYEWFNNGAGPMWCSGSTCLVRHGDTVFASGMENVKDSKPMNNARWTLYKRASEGWVLQQRDEVDRTREPSPLGVFNDGRLFLSVNPTLTPPEAYNGPAQPKILQFSSDDPKSPFQTLLPKWQGAPKFTQHSYRSFAVDGANREMILFQNIGYTHAMWSFFDRNGDWSAQGRIDWPWGAEYDKPQPIRVCYPTVALVNRAVYFCGVSDIVEPYNAWRDFKYELTGRKWDYDFRRLFFASCLDVTKRKFSDWIEISSRDKTAGWISPCDLWVGPDGAIHLLWTERALDERLREKFFPDEKQSFALNYAVLSDGHVSARRSLVIGGEGLGHLRPGRGRFHVTADSRLFVLYYLGGKDKTGKSISENRLMEIYSDGSNGDGVKIPLSQPLSNFFTATPRGGSAPSNVLDVLGDVGEKIRYARIRLAE